MPGKTRPHSQGNTILEVMITLFILTCTVTAVMQLMVTGDRINGRRMGLSAANLLAGNQAETIRNQEKSLALLGDTSYEAEVNGLYFNVQRTRISPSETPPLDSIINYIEFSIIVKRKNIDMPLVGLRLLQGLHGK